MRINNRFLSLLCFTVLASGLLLTPNRAAAWTPCMPFCATCETAQMATLGGKAVGNIAILGAFEATLLGNIASMTANTALKEALWVKDIQLDHMKLVHGINATISDFEVALEKQGINQGKLMDHKLTQLKETVRKLYAANLNIATTQNFSDSAQPIFGNLGNLRAESFGQSYREARALRSELLTQQMDYMNSGSYGVSDSAQVQKLLNSEKFENFKGDNAFNPSYEPMDFESLQYVLSSTFLESPLPADTAAMQTQSGDAHKRELERRRYINLLAVIMSGVNEAMASRQILAESDWINAYALAPTVDGEISEYENNASLVKGRISAPGWFMQVKQLNPIGLQRLQSYLLAEENTLRYLSDRTRTAYINTLGTMALIKLEQNAENLR